MGAGWGAVGGRAGQGRVGGGGMGLKAALPAELQALLGSEIRRWGEVIRKAKIDPE